MTRKKVERNSDYFEILVLQSTGTGYVVMVLGDAFGLLGGFQGFNADCSYCASRVDTVLTTMDIAHIIAFLPVEAV